MNSGIYTISEYIECKTTLLDKIKAINALISSMELKILDVIEGAVYDEYNLDDGQMKVKTKYRNPKDVTAGITALEQLKQRYVNRYNGRRTIFRSGNF
tara:strand:- start:44 stop:337 length:294 start_codon:yes stop_codon:yes gene_type:complete